MNLKDKEEIQYIHLINKILNDGYISESRNGNTKMIYGYQMRYSLKEGKLPLLTSKFVSWKTCFKELKWFISGKTDNKILQEDNIKIWNHNSSKEYLNSIGLNYEENDLGPIYGHQWRYFNAPYIDCKTDYKKEENKGIDQIELIIKQLKNPETRNSRRIILTAWNPEQIELMALPPCHILAQFNVRDNKYLSCILYQRSGDVGLGIPFNIASYSFLTHILAVHCDLIAEEFIHFIGNAHIYEEHIPILEEQIKRELFDFPKIKINKKENIEDYNINDIIWLEEYIYNNNDTKMIIK